MNAFEQARIGSILLNNRVIRSATHEGLADETGKPTEALIKKYELLCKGEVGAIITGYAGIQQNGKACLKNMLMIDKDELVEEYKKVTSAVHKYNTPMIIQIAHCGRQTRSKITGHPTVAPSPIKDKLYNEDIPHKLSENEINEIIKNFVVSIKRAKEAGFDGVQLHLAHGYLLSSFLSPHTNIRTDKWGGNTENRFRIVDEIYKLARKEIGDYPILAKINGFEKSNDGIKLSEAVKISMLLEKAGCDAIEVSSGLAEEGFMTSRGTFPFDALKKYNNRIKKLPRFILPLIKPILKSSNASPEPLSLYNLETAQEIKKAVNIPVIVVGGIRKAEEIKNIIENEKCDFVSMCRPFILEADIVKKFKEGRQTESKCINCNYCLIGSEEKSLRCYYGKIKGD